MDRINAQTASASMTRRGFVAGATATAASIAIASACQTDAEAKAADSADAPAKPDAPIDGAFTTRALGHESWVNVTTTFAGDTITACQVISHKETIGIGSYACARIPAAIVQNQSVEVPNVHGASVTSNAVKDAVRQAIELSGRNVEDFSAKVALPTSDEHAELSADVVIMGGGTAGLVAATRLLDNGLSVIVVEKLDIPGGSASMTMGGVQTAGSARQNAFDIAGAYAGTASSDLEVAIEGMKARVQEGLSTEDGDLPFQRVTYGLGGEMADWMSSIGIGFMTLGTYEGAASYGYTLSSAPGMYCGGAGYQTMFLANRIAAYENGQILYGTTVDGLIQDESGTYVGVNATANTGATYTITARAVCLASGGFAKNVDMLKEYCPDHADFFFNCCSASTGDGIRLGLEAGSPMACIGRYMPAYLATRSGVELAFIGLTAPGLFVNVNGDNLGSAVSHTNGERVLLGESNKGTFFYVFDDSSACKAADNESFGMQTYNAIFEREEAVHYGSVEEAAEALELPNLAASIEENNAKALSGDTSGGFGAQATYIETRDGIWVLPVTPNFYLTTAGLTIDTACHLLDADGNVIPGLYAAGDVTASPEERDGLPYGYGYSTAMAFGYQMALTITAELVA